MYGQSVGSGPALELATRLPRLRAVILHSPILSDFSNHLWHKAGIQSITGADGVAIGTTSIVGGVAMGINNPIGCNVANNIISSIQGLYTYILSI